MYEAITAGDKDFTALITKMKEAGVDLIYLGGYHTEAGLITRQAREQGLNAQHDVGRRAGRRAVLGDHRRDRPGHADDLRPDPRKNEAAAAASSPSSRPQGYDPEGYTLYTYAAIQAWAAGGREGRLDRSRGGRRGAAQQPVRDRARHDRASTRRATSRTRAT